ncbi:pyridoxamine 5'-phosphate oxidase family protein [Haloarcula onubensis]|uniref:Pyridoxamine 5'-phosphate oxidase family protein n=1 Tax=Haloarcula onubensis TaxID=2950539 RepID=A0ABU2FQM4_9EURY|nr:pyridoxamine 5'-phosphate oxidase family protein [Halomicroarcula sp. S3CR25-11]MDS0283048.1 pyridoxamine 5'-phosphate oxidase family protein [Halomicroarcula sp. S3CR25-11]
MENLRWPRMTEDELTAFLGDGGTGVISFSTSSDDSPYSIPVSYGFNSDVKHFHFRLALPPGSEKEALVARPVSFVTHDQADEGWRSVVATGSLEDLTDEPYESSAIQERWGVDVPVVDIFEEPPEDVAFRKFRLVPDQLTGRKQIRSEE